MWRLKGPDASKCTSRSRSLTQSRITTCHRGRRHRRHVGDRGTCTRGKERQERTEDKRIDVATSLGWKWGIAYVISSSWSNSRRTHSGKPLLWISIRANTSKEEEAAWPSLRISIVSWKSDNSSTVHQRGQRWLFVIPSFQRQWNISLSLLSLFFFVILCIHKRILRRITVGIIDC